MTQTAHYVLIDCDKVQEYVFASSRLREICKASLLLDQLEVETLPAKVKSLAGTTVRSGGGVVLARFDNKDHAEKFIRLARDSYRACGISATFSDPFPVSLPIRNFYDQVLCLLHKMIRSRKDSPEGRKLHISTLLAVSCESSGVGPAQHPRRVPDGQVRRMGRSEAKKRAHRSDAIEGESELGRRLDLGLPRDFGGLVGWTTQRQDSLQERDLPGTSEERLLGIVYADVNGLGKQVPFVAGDENSYAIFAREVRETVKTSLIEALEQVLSPAVDQRYPPSKPRPSTAALPAKALYVGGDDLAVAIQGRYALNLAGKLLDLFEKKSAALFKPPAGDPSVLSSFHLTMSAGVVLAPYDYPIQNFNRVGHELEARAKRFGRGQNRSSPPSLVDFCLIKNNAAGSLQQVRQGQRIDSFLLYGGPYTPDELNRLKETAGKLKEKKFPRNKLKQLREILATQEQTAEFKYMDWWHGLEEENRNVFIDQVCTPFNLCLPPSLPRQNKGYWVTPVIDLVELSDL